MCLFSCSANEKAPIEYRDMTSQSCSDVQSLYIFIALKPVFLMLSITAFPLGNINLVSFVNPLKLVYTNTLGSTARVKINNFSKHWDFI